MPCSGEDRPNQAFVQLNNGAFASAASDTNLCIDGGGASSDVVPLDLQTRLESG